VVEIEDIVEVIGFGERYGGNSLVTIGYV